MTAFSQYIIYADESGSPVLGADATDYPIFVLNFLLVEKRIYVERVVPNLQRFKFQFFGHDKVILHEKDIVEQRGSFAVLRQDARYRSRFLESFSGLIANRDFAIIYAVVDKSKMIRTSDNHWSPYDIALGLCMETAAEFLVTAGEDGSNVHVVFEARGKKEDELLELDFRRIASGRARVGSGTDLIQGFQWTPIFADNKSNSAGLQIADLAARPLGLAYLWPNQTNRAFSAMRTTSAAGGAKLYH